MNNDADYIKRNSRLIELTLEALGIFAKVQEVNILDKFYEYYLELAVGTDLENLKKHDIDLAMALASPTGKVYWQIPVAGTIYAGLKVPKSSKEYFENLKEKELATRKSKTLLGGLAFAFFIIGEANHWIARKLLDKDQSRRTKHTKLFYRAIARIKAVNEKEGAVLIDRMISKFHIDPVRAYKLKEELVEAGILRQWNDVDFEKTSSGKKTRGNINWDNINKYKIPKEIQEFESKRVNEEKKKGLLPKTIGELKK